MVFAKRGFECCNVQRFEDGTKRNYSSLEAEETLASVFGGGLIDKLSHYC